MDLRKLKRSIVLVLLDIFAIVACNGLALFIRFDFVFSKIDRTYLDGFWYSILVQAVVVVVVFSIARLYRLILSTVGIRDAITIFLCTTLASIISMVICEATGIAIPKSVVLIAYMLEVICFEVERCSVRMASVILRERSQSAKTGERLMLIGAGAAGMMVLREMLTQSSRIKGSLVCIIDDDKSKQGKYVNGIPVAGGRESIISAAKKYDVTEIVFAIPTASAADQRDILELCTKTGCKVKKLPGIYQLVNGEVSLASLNDVQVEDLLGREPAKLDTQKVQGFLKGKTVLVTGGGGSIGSELCRQIALYEPKRLIILDIYENNAYDIQQELKRKFENLDLRVEIASIRDKAAIYSIFQEQRPDIVFHAAAHKHVPLMEECPREAVKNNIFGTWHVVRAAEKFGTKKVVMISTDKAVNPTNFMGATKRFCEMILQSKKDSTTEFCAVRFGNVLGSNGSVVPLFKRQIEAGGPVTITDKRVIRYFMTIPEAAQLVLEAGAMAQRGQIFVLDMGDPVRIVDMAEKLIRLSGLEPYTDIEIKEIGLRPGEKLYEELLTDNDNLLRTANDKIFVEQVELIPEAEMMEKLETLDKALQDDISPEDLIRLLKEMVPTYKAPEQVNDRLAGK